PPRSIVQGQRIRWFTNFVTLGDVQGAPFTLVPMQDTAKSPAGGLLLLSREGAGWQRRWVATSDIPPMGSSVVATGRKSFVAAFTGDRAVGSDTSINAVFVARIASEDTSAAVRILRRVGTRAAVEPKLFRIGRAVHLMWIER